MSMVNSDYSKISVTLFPFRFVWYLEISTVNLLVVHLIKEVTPFPTFGSKSVRIEESRLTLKHLIEYKLSIQGGETFIVIK